MRDQTAETAMMLAAQQAREDVMFRRYVDMAVNEAMRHAEQVRSEVDRRDLHHVATLAAMTVLRMALDENREINRLTQERDHYRKLAEANLRLQPFPMTLPPSP